MPARQDRRDAGRLKLHCGGTGSFPAKQHIKKCVACHTIDKGGRNGVGPNMHGVMGRSGRSVAGYSYSAAMKAKGGVWDEAALDAISKTRAKPLSARKCRLLASATRTNARH